MGNKTVNKTIFDTIKLNGNDNVTSKVSYVQCDFNDILYNANKLYYNCAKYNVGLTDNDIKIISEFINLASKLQYDAIKNVLDLDESNMEYK